MSAFTRLCALCHLDLDLFRTYEVTAGNTETSGCYLFDRRAAVQLAVLACDTIRILTTFTGI